MAENETKTEETTTTEPVKGKSIIDPKYRDKYKTPDWLAQLLIDNASVIKEVKTKAVVDGKVTDQVITKQVPDGVDIDKLFAIARENGVDVDNLEKQRDSHGFAGRARMTVRNMLQTVIKQRHGLTLNGEWVDAPEDWLKSKGAPDSPTHNHDGTKIAVAKTEKPAAEAKPVPPIRADDAKPTEAPQPAQTAKAPKKGGKK